MRFTKIPRNPVTMVTGTDEGGTNFSCSKFWTGINAGISSILDFSQMGNTSSFNVSSETTELDLTSKGLVIYPKELYKCQQLIKLVLKDNEFTELPSFLNLTKLQTLDVSHNRLGSLPHLSTALVSFYASKNRLFFTPLSAQIGTLANLQRLDLSENQLEYALKRIVSHE